MLQERGKFISYLNRIIPKKHWKPRYIIDRIGVLFYEFKNPDSPWLAKDSISILSSWINENEIGLEWGSGRSTLWLAKKVKHLTSVEHNIKWYNYINSKINELGINNVDYIYTHSSYQPNESNYLNGTEKINQNYYNLIDEFRKLTNVPVLLNTSLNENEPIVNTPQEAIECFKRSGMDVLYIEEFRIENQ